MNKFSKRVMALLLSAVIAMSLILTASAVDGKYGDVNGDTKINSSDALNVLKYSVGDFVFTDAEFVLADVNGDNKVNSSDALEILLFSVGKINKFSVDKSVDVPETKNEMLAVYINAIKDARDAKPSYKLKIDTETKDADVDVKKVDLPFIDMVVPDFPQEEIDRMEQDMIQKDSYQSIMQKGSTGSLDNLLAECKITDASKFAGVTCEVLESGNYKIDIKLKDEVNPASNGVAVQALGLPDYNTIKNSLTNQGNSGTSGAENIKLGEIKSVKYANCWISCVVDAQTGELVSLEWNSDMVINMVISVPLMYDISISMTMATYSSYSNFAY